MWIGLCWTGTESRMTKFLWIAMFYGFASSIYLFGLGFWLEGSFMFGASAWILYQYRKTIL